MEIKKTDLHTIENIARTSWIQYTESDLSDAELVAFAWTKAVLSVLTRYGYPDIELSLEKKEKSWQ